MAGGGNDTQTTEAEPWGPQGDALKKLLRHAEQWFKSEGSQNNVYEGQTVADQSQAQLDAQETLLGNVSELDSQAQAANESNQQLLNASDVGNNPIVADAIQSALNPLAKQFTNVVLPSLKVDGMGGGYTSSRQGVIEANASRDFGDTSSNLVGQLMGDFYNKGLDAQSRGVALAPSVQAMVNAGGRNQAAVGDAQQSYEQQVLTDAQQKFYTDQNSPLDRLFNYRYLITGSFGGSTTSPASQQPGTLGQMIGGGLTGYAATGNPWGAAAGAAVPLL